MVMDRSATLSLVPGPHEAEVVVAREEDGEDWFEGGRGRGVGVDWV